MPKFNDIKPNLLVEDFSFYVFLATCFAVVFVILLSIYLMYKFVKNKKPTKAVVAKNILKNIDFSSSKTAAYTISKYGRFLLDTNEKAQIFKELEKELEAYKYKLEEMKFKDEHKALFNAFLELCDV